MMPRKSFWTGKRVLLTGHTGFKGSWLALWLHSLGAEVCGISLPPCTDPNLFSLARIDQIVENHFIDIRNSQQLCAQLNDSQPDIVFHLAAQPLVRASYRNPLETFSTNVMGTAHLLEALREMSMTKVAIIITTDKVYRDQKWPYPYRENDLLGGHDPYSASKAAAEIVTTSYRDAFLNECGLSVATARAGNVIGGGDWSEDRLIPDAVRAWQADQAIEIRSPEAIRPWQHVLEPLSGYLGLAEKLWKEPELAGPYNFGPEPSTAATVREVIEKARTSYGKGQIVWGDKDQNLHETILLSLDISKASTSLGYRPLWTLRQAIDYTMKWYLNQAQGNDCRQLCLSEIAAYEAQT